MSSQSSVEMVPQEILDELRALYEQEGCSIAELSRLTGIPDNRIKGAFFFAGIHLRNHREAREVRVRHHDRNTALRTARILQSKYAQNIMRISASEARLRDIFLRHQVPFEFVGDGKVVLERFCPDFISTDRRKLIIEVGNGVSIERLATYRKYGYKTVAIQDQDVLELKEEELLAFIGHSKRW